MNLSTTPLYEKSLSQQIIEAGGTGWNCGVVSERAENSFSYTHRFKTEDGHGIVVTPNTYHVGLIHDTQGKAHYIEYDGDTKSYYLITTEPTGANKSLEFIKEEIGTSFVEMKMALENKWPRRVVWKLYNPEHEV